MRSKFLAANFICLLFIFSSLQCFSATGNVREILAKAVAAMGGEDKLRALKTVETTSIGQLNWLEQSERPEGPYFVSYEQTHTFLNLDEKKSSQSIESKSLQNLDWSARAATYIVSTLR